MHNIFLMLEYCHVWPSGATWSWLLCPLTCPHPSFSTFLLSNKSTGSFVLSQSPSWKQTFPKKPWFILVNRVWRSQVMTPLLVDCGTQCPFPVPGCTSFLNNWWRNVFLHQRTSPHSQAHSLSLRIVYPISVLSASIRLIRHWVSELVWALLSTFPRCQVQVTPSFRRHPTALIISSPHLLNENAHASSKISHTLQ